MTSNWEPLLRRNPLRAAFLGAGLGLFFLFIGLNRPTIANMRKIDLLHLLATGGFFGVAVVGVVLYLVGRRKG
jgi:hypothetical protein